MSIKIVYYSSSGNTEGMANAIKEALPDAEILTSDAVSATDLTSADALALGSSATGAEEVESTLEGIVDEALPGLSGKKVLLFGSWGWGGGEYLNAWKSKLEGAGVNVVADPISAMGPADDDTIAKLKEASKALL